MLIFLRLKLIAKWVLALTVLNFMTLIRLVSVSEWSVILMRSIGFPFISIWIIVVLILLVVMIRGRLVAALINIGIRICTVLISLIIVVHVILISMTLIVIMMRLAANPVCSSSRSLIGWIVARIEGAILLVIIMMLLFYIINLISSFTGWLDGLQGSVIHSVGSIDLVLAIVDVHLALCMTLETLISNSLARIVHWELRYLPCLTYWFSIDWRFLVAIL